MLTRKDITDEEYESFSKVDISNHKIIKQIQTTLILQIPEKPSDDDPVVVETSKDAPEIIVHDEILDWCEKNCSGRFGFMMESIEWKDPSQAVFEKEEDAILFKFTWF